MTKLKVAWFDALTGTVDEALRHLPELEICPRDLYSRIISLKLSEHTRIAVVFEDREPLAVSAMIRRDRFVWEPLTNWLFPGPAFPAALGRHVDALASLGVKVPLACWRTPTPPLAHPAIEFSQIEPSFAMTELSKRKEFWRRTGYLPRINKMRERTARLQVKVGAVEYAASIITRWSEKWLSQGAESSAVQGRILLANALEPVGKHVTIALVDGDHLAAGATQFVDAGVLVAGVSYIDPKYRSIGAGIRMIEELFDFAAAKNLAGFDIGSGGDYKRKWAPPHGHRTKLTIANSRARLLSRCDGAARRIRRAIGLSPAN